jgi:hypothetical protein
MYDMVCITAMSDEENEKLVTVRAFLPPELRTSFKSICVKQGVTMNDAIVQFVEDYVRQHELETLERTRAAGKVKKGE